MPVPPLSAVARRLRPVDPATDRELLTRYLSSKDEAAFETLVRRHERAVLAACRQVLADPADAEDAFQATFLVLLRKADRVAWQPSLGGWLYAVAHRVAVHARRTARLRKAREEAAAAPAEPQVPTPDLSWREACQVMHEELDRLPDGYRLPLLLCYLRGLTRDEAAAQLGWTVGAVRGRLDRGRRALQKQLARRGVTLSAGLLAVVATRSAGAPPRGLADATVAAVGRPSPAVAALVRAVSPAVSKGKAVLASLVLVGLIGAGLGGGGDKPSAKPDDPPPAKPAPAGAKPADKPAGRTITVKVVGPDGKPVAAARILARQVRQKGDDPSALGRVRELGRTEDDGRFRTTPPAAVEFTRSLYAVAPGFGVGRVEVRGDGDEDLALKLVADHPVTGRVVTTEGKPVAGARVVLDRVAEDRDGLDAFLTAFQADPRRASSDWSRSVPVGWAEFGTTAATDADGRFRLPGGGRDRLLHVEVRGDGLAATRVTVVNRPGFDPAPYNEAARKAVGRRDGWMRLHGPDLVVVAEPGKVIEGVVRDADTKAPVAGSFVGCNDQGAWSDADGKFRLTGLRKTARYDVYAGSPKDSDYLPGRSRAVDTDGFAPVSVVVELRRGVVLTGRVTDRATGTGVRGGVLVLPLAGNPHFVKAAGPDRLHDAVTYHTDEAGRYRVVTVPGRVLVTASGFGDVPLGDEELSRYRAAGPDPKFPDLFRPLGSDSWLVEVADLSSRSVSGYDHAVRVADLPDGKPSTLDLTVDPGRAGTLRVVGEDGGLVPGVVVAGLDDTGRGLVVPDGTAPLLGLDPRKPRAVYAYHADRKLAGRVTARGDEAGPVVLRLGPVGTVTGKLVGPDGKPVAGAKVSLKPEDDNAGRAVDPAGRRGSSAETAADGSFAVGPLVPGATYTLTASRGRDRLATAAVVPVVPVAGKPLDLGAVTVAPGKPPSE